jgi:hypothetical protein
LATARPDGARTLLHSLVDWPGHRAGAPELLGVLIEFGADVNAPFGGPQHDETPLHWAASADDVVMVDALLDAGADLEARGGTIAGGTVMTLAWGLLFKLMPPGERGAISGLATTTKGIGLVIGPLAAGAVIDILGPHLEDTDGYQALWPVLGIPIILAIPLVARLAPAEAAACTLSKDLT